MVRINLLPAEILDKRRFEGRFSWVLVVAIILGAAIVITFVVGLLIAGLKSQELEAKQAEVTSLQEQAEAYKVFEDRMAELSGKQGVVQGAKQGRIDWGRLATEVSLVLPSDVWVERLTADQGGGIQIQGWAVDDPDDVPDAGFKTIAATLVRLASLEQLHSVWLTSSNKAIFANTGKDAISFTITTGVRSQDATQSPSGVPAPPEGSP